MKIIELINKTKLSELLKTKKKYSVEEFREKLYNRLAEINEIVEGEKIVNRLNKLNAYGK